MRLAIADPPYPPSRSGMRRASRWYGDQPHAFDDLPADVNPAATEWDEPERHRELMDELLRDFDGWAIATSADGLDVYHPLPLEARVMVWVRPNAQPGSHRLRNLWEAVVLCAPEGRRTNRNGAGSVDDVLVANAPGGFIGAKPEPWVAWVLRALSFDPETDEVIDLFPGSGAVGYWAAAQRLV